MNQEFRISADVLDLMDQPVFLAADGTVTDCNRAAFTALIREGMPVEDFIAPDYLSVYRSYTDGTPFSLQVLIAGKPRNATVLTRPEGQLFVADPEPRVGPMVPATSLMGMTHAVRAPLSGLLAAAERLTDHVRDLEDSQSREDVLLARRECYRLLHTACGINDMMSVLLGDFRVVRERTDVSGWLRELCGRAASLCAAVDVELEARLPETELTAWIDRQKLERALLNLVCNALRYRRPDGHITVELCAIETQKQLVITVTDDGRGLDGGDWKDLYTRYERGEQIADPRWGLGFGLPLLQNTVHFHSGAVTFSSQSGHGACVRIMLPTERPNPADPRLGSPVMDYDYAGGYAHELVELAEAMPYEVFVP